MRRIFYFALLLLLFGFAPRSTDRLVVISTDYGKITIKLYEKTPLHSDNFWKLAKEGYFDKTLFHRVIQHFVIQGGDPDSREAKPGQLLGDGGPAYTIPLEVMPEYFHKRGAVGMGRENDDVNPTMASAGSQFYIVQGKKFTDAGLDTIYKKVARHHPKAAPFVLSTYQRETYKTIGGIPHLDGFYTVFGEVVKGMEVVDKIAAVKTDTNDRPVVDVRMKVKVRN
jgi:cyclophilin family peptidyl-prolyl cis-trans isomerase